MQCFGTHLKSLRSAVCLWYLYTNVFGTSVVAGRGRLTIDLELQKLLMVIDDIDEVAQLKNLLPPCKLHEESLVIVTSRKRSVLTACRIGVIEVQLLPEGCDTQLFKAWAFAMGQPAWATSQLVTEIVACCGRLPLTLKVSIALALTFIAFTSCSGRLIDCEGGERMYCMPAGHGCPPELPKRTGK